MSSEGPDLPRLFVAGSGPLPPENPDQLSAPGLRIWGIARELAAAGHPVRLATINFHSPAPLGEVFVRDLELRDGVVVLPAPRVVPVADQDLSSALRSEAEDFGARALVGSSEVLNRHLAAIDSRLPLWCDYDGDPMAERQMLARLHQNDALLADQWRDLVTSLRRLDRASSSSRQQAGALVAELAAVGRLNRHTADGTLVQVMPVFTEPITPAGDASPILRGVAVPQDAFIVLQTGGFNTWLDIETLFAVLERAMSEHPRLHFAATGGALALHDDRTFERFQEFVAASKFRDRYHLLGWLPLNRLPRVIEESDLGLNVDLPCAEGWLGSRNRIMTWILGGLPVVSTVGCELALELSERDLIIGVDQSDADGLIAAIRDQIEGPGDSDRSNRAAREFLEKHHSARECLRPLLEWARDPKPASDLHSWRMGESRPPALWTGSAEEADRAVELDELRSKLRKLQVRGKTLEGSLLVRAAIRLRGLLGPR